MQNISYLTGEVTLSYKQENVQKVRNDKSMHSMNKSENIKSYVPHFCHLDWNNAKLKN